MSLERFFRPESIAVVGGSEAERVVHQLDGLGYQGEVWPVHPTRHTVGGRTCLRDISELPDGPDVAFVGVPREAATQVVGQLAAAGCGGVVVYASGYGEAGEYELESALVAAAKGMPLLGPNTYGYVNALDGVAIWPDVHGLETISGGVAIGTQSGNIGINLTMARRSLPIGKVVTTGNQAGIDMATLVESFLDDHRITAIGLQLESIGDGQAFGRAAMRASEQGVPIVALKMGKSDQGNAITTSHTGALGNGSETYDALFRYYGISQVGSIPTFLETLKIAAVAPPAPNVLVLSSSGGEAAHIADLAASHGVGLPALSSTQVDRVRETVSPLVAISNPMDYHTVAWGDGDALAATFGALAYGPFDILLLVLDFPAGAIWRDWWTAVEAFAGAAQASVGLVASSLPETMPPEAQARVRSLGLVPMLGLVEAIEAIGSLAERPSVSIVHTSPRVLPTSQTMNEFESKSLLSAAGIDVPDGVVADDPTTTPIPYPITVKVLGLDHKSVAGGVAVGISDRSSVAESLESMPWTAEYLVEETVTGGVAELLVNLRSNHLGWLLTLGNGGTRVEELDDRIQRLMPIDTLELEIAIDELRAAPALRRGQADIDALWDVVMKLEILVQSDDRVVEVEINPLLLKRQGAIALDAMVSVT